jgi:hypothetical protein
VPWRHSIRAAPIEEGDGGGLDQFINAALSAEICVLVYLPPAEAQNPGLNIPLRDQMNDRLTFGTCGYPSLIEGLSELAKTLSYVACIGVNRHDERRFRACGPTPVRCDSLWILVAHPLRSTTPTVWQGIEADFVSMAPQFVKVLANQSLMPFILREDYDQRGPTHAPIREL